MPGRLTTEVVDSARGEPAAHLLIDLFQLPSGGRERHHVRTVETDEHGRIAGALIENEAFRPAVYELLYHVGRYFKSRPAEQGSLFDVVPVRFAVGDANCAYCISFAAGPRSYAVSATTEPGS